MLHALCLSALLAGQSADVVTSLQHTRGYVERNPFVPSHPAAFVSLKAGLTTTLAVAGWKIRKTRPKTAAVLFLLGAASGSLAAVHNARLPQVRRP